ncbi:MAG: hypothetical protein BV459_06345 [Thermoplasmata archaeon M11B2D]|nr:MAG: hypothetical protein BV459_06345 [Thermoplasmata archaeon M11B2D]
MSKRKLSALFHPRQFFSDRKMRKSFRLDYECGVDPVPVEILCGKYAGVKYQYGKVGITPSDPPILHFVYHILENPSGVDTDTADFIGVAGDTLSFIMKNDMYDELSTTTSSDDLLGMLDGVDLDLDIS